MKKLGVIIREGPPKEDVATSRREFFAERFSKEGFEYHPFRWQDMDRQDLQSFDLIYLFSLGPFEGGYKTVEKMVGKLSASGRPVMNDPTVMLDNFDKGYLLDLQARGVSTIPTRDVSDLGLEGLKEFSFDGFGDFILKPKRYGERSLGVVKATELRDEDMGAFQGKGILAQPYLSGILDGERSLVFVGNNYSHTAFRNRTGWNTNNTHEIKSTNPTDLELRVAEDVLNNIEGPKDVTRIDFITQDSVPMVSEVERINPNTWLCQDGLGFEKTFFPLLANHIRDKLDSN
jgi:glutathione synthase/RimK-type ligase-like ATP-grasp enzyme